MSAIRSSTKYLIVALAGAAVVVLAMNWATRLEAAPSHTIVVAQSTSSTHDGMVDRSRKGDRLDFVAPATRGGMPIGCDAPFSSLAKLPPSKVVGRCLTWTSRVHACLQERARRRRSCSVRDATAILIAYRHGLRAVSR